MSEFISGTQVNENVETTKEVFHPPIYPNSDNPKEVEKIVGEFNKYYTRLKRFFMVSKSDSEKIINDLKIEEITRLKLLLKYFLHKDKINMDDLRYVTQMIQEIHNKDYENRKKSEVKKPNKPKSKKPNYQSQGQSQGFRRNNSKQSNNSYSRKTYSSSISSTSSYIHTFHDSHPYQAVEVNKFQQKPDEFAPIEPSNNSVKEEKEEETKQISQQQIISKPPKKDKSNSKYMKKMNYQHSGKNKK